MVLEDERPSLVHMALEAELVLRRRRTQLLGHEPAVLVMTVRAFHEALVYAVMERLLKVRLGLEVAGVAQLWLSLDQQGLASLRVVRRMAIHTAHAVHIVLAAPEVAVLFAVFVAFQAALASFTGGDVLEGEDLRLVPAGFHVFLSGPMAGLATLPLWSSSGVVGCFPMRRFLEILEDILVAGLAGLCSHILGRIDS